MFCEKCGQQLEDGTAVCPKCSTSTDDKVTVQDVKEAVREKLESLNKQIKAAKEENRILREKEEELAKIRQENAMLKASVSESSSVSAQEENQTATENPSVNVNLKQSANPADYIGLVIENYNPKYNYNPIGMWGYFGYTILFSIPVIGFIMTLVFAFGAGKNINLRNFARSYFCVSIIVFVFVILAAASGASMMF